MMGRKASHPVDIEAEALLGRQHDWWCNGLPRAAVKASTAAPARSQAGLPPQKATKRTMSCLSLRMLMSERTKWSKTPRSGNTYCML